MLENTNKIIEWPISITSHKFVMHNLDSYMHTYVRIHTYMYVHNYNSAGCRAASTNKR